jgi:hypothetical protein
VDNGVKEEIQAAQNQPPNFQAKEKKPETPVKNPSFTRVKSGIQKVIAQKTTGSQVPKQVKNRFVRNMSDLKLNSRNPDLSAITVI